jgi:hypothetical protein
MLSSIDLSSGALSWSHRSHSALDKLIGGLACGDGKRLP